MGLINARGGSKGIPRKNIQKLDGTKIHTDVNVKKLTLVESAKTLLTERR